MIDMHGVYLLNLVALTGPFILTETPIVFEIIDVYSELLT